MLKSQYTIYQIFEWEIKFQTKEKNHEVKHKEKKEKIKYKIGKCTQDIYLFQNKMESWHAGD